MLYRQESSDLDKGHKPSRHIDEEAEARSADPGATGSAIATRGAGTRGSGFLTPCSNNVLADVDRIEILIGGK